MFLKSKKGTEEPKNTSNSSINSNPYVNGRREWMERYGSYIKERNRWRLISLITSCIALVAVFGVIYIGSQSKYVPYVVQVDRLGSTVGTQRADIAMKPDSRIIKAQIEVDQEI
ncbi:VirB8/TrbF family protein [Acinetobacter lwoffii]|uniref:VirB8/TrbF family protein n=1 Tax=Acinetobacter lwoffii TaxID=28090 RepID=A0AAW8B031_ACILW|nr:VirB8/TrbF family protein [Acinetobacter lwoffii]MDP1372068.1 VirB8/TrbF family protein [Acinetobacter lwoffii]MDP1391507.1 VirB8/TrbF family protein [Acinetobacter lwoffii]MDP1449179.1 VirB8/TrbF family protein [Acinetobacter lwoffii]